MRSKSPMPLPLKILGVLLFGAIVATTVLGQLRGPFFGPAAITAAGLVILLGLCLVADFRGSAEWLGQHAKDNASMYLNAAAPDKGTYRVLGVGFAVLGLAIEIVLSALVDNGYIFLTVIYDDGTIQQKMDRLYGPKIVAVVSALRPAT